MTRGLDDLTLTFYETNKTKTIDDNKVKHISLLVLKISFLTLIGFGVKINPIFGYRVKISADINPRNIWFDGLVLTTP